MPDAIPLWDRTTLRILAVAGYDPDEDGSEPGIRAVARMDVVVHPALGVLRGKMMSARHEHGAADGRGRPFTGPRLRNAIWNPLPPDVLVAACPSSHGLVPGDIHRGLPWIHVLTALRHLRSTMPSFMARVCWEHGEDDLVPEGASGNLVREAWFVAQVLSVLLRHASPRELVALSREGV